MPKKIIIKQFALPFDADIVQEVWELWQVQVEKWHKFQKQNRFAGNEFFWWRSRYSEWIQEMRPRWTTAEYLEKDKLFPRLWEKHGEEMQGSPISGVPKEAYSYEVLRERYD